ncbi:MAG: N-acetyl-gamma-glutamyl-phosphate reductase [Candidatus Omnitrophica bacterium]|nr:N-acetyl-gamma-glutamyl-phosphate reductase [Candidatus Omnitrophota bacterium]MDD5575037.1 N-acetyl-gamma-glutamyl-phosphate reductase [Candidatus Omnitrophota bacterium]
MLKVGIIGARGFTGEELTKILMRHPHVRLTYLAATLEKPEDIGRIFPALRGVVHLKCEPFSVERAVEKCDLLFLALPHTVSMDFAPKLIKRHKKIVDLSADYRLKNPAVYKQWYHKTHKDVRNLKAFVYGLPELYRQRIRKAACVANPGCYPTAAILGIVPALVAGFADKDGIIIDAKSGVSGAGKKVAAEYIYLHVNENFRGYKFNVHQHSPEINQELSRASISRVDVAFCPHLLPVSRGILETIYIRLKKSVSAAKILDVYKKFYKREPFVRVRELGELPQLSDVTYTNFCDVGIVVDEKKRLLIVISVIDNLLKGAAGQAVQNMNIMCGFEERTALV